ncbi:penicillin-binding protein [Parvularcula bermudensis HTCC2503]|uniref:Penicillin-binding protein n=1 Tax=Parvularcula bermudensis (strain ATCC BAA-594 / HTCC2503 / KCTC 12087) TaxID=314260 RepID=E0TCZ3_PARBH|nr:penicillin-binding protein [Parvularcula bermudensis HTCC2503]
MALRASSLLLPLIAVLLGASVIFLGELPPIDGLETARKQPRIVVLDRRGDVIGIRGQDRGEPIDAATLPDHVKAAFLATEDRNFYHHIGINPVAITRAIVVNMRAGTVQQGGSTITQQLVKNLLLTPERSMKRKVQEMILALRIEAAYTKDEILSFYLNAVYFGNGAYGIEAAARRYFQKAPASLSVPEAALLAGLLKAPSRYAPTADKDRAIQRAKVVINAMVETGAIDSDDAATYSFEGVASIEQADSPTAWAADAAIAELYGLVDEAKGRDLTIHTTIDSELSRRTAAAQERLWATDSLLTDDVELAALILDENGAIRVMIGGRSYRSSAYNRATRANRQPGSVFKPVVYLTALEQGWRPDDKIADTPFTVDGYAPTNYSRRYSGIVTIEEAMRRSLNVATVRLQEQIGRERVVETAQRLGLPARDVGPSLALGTLQAAPLDIASAYLPLSAGGQRAVPFMVTKATGAEDQLIYRRRPPRPMAAVVDKDDLVAFDHMMRAVVERGTGRAAAVPGHYAAGKTGTSQDNRDGWFAGYASGRVGVVWIGRDDDRPVRGGGRALTGGGPPAKLWGEMMTAALRGVPPRQPTPWVPETDGMRLFDHLTRILAGREEDLPRRRDGISALINRAEEAR